MANYSILKAAIEDVIKQNGNNEITGALLQQSLLAIINSLGSGFQFVDVATPSTNPGMPDQNVFYFASEAGVYSNFSGIVVADGEVAILKYNGSWSKESTGIKQVSVLQNTQILKIGGEEVGALGGVYEENPEWEKVVIDNDGKILYGVKTDGRFYFGAGCPPQVLAALAGKVDKEIGMSLIDAVFASAQQAINSPEYIFVIVDQDGKLLEGIKKTTGERIFNTDIKGRIASFSKELSVNGNRIYMIDDKESRNYIILDSEDKIISYRDSAGNLHENVGVTCRRLGIGNNSVFPITDDTRVEIKLDGENRIVSYRDSYGVLHELSGVDTEHLYLSEDGLKALVADIKDAGLELGVSGYSSPKYPKYGKTNVKSETFFLTQNASVSSIDDVVCLQDFPDTDLNAAQRMSICHYYVKNTLTNNGDGTYSINENSVRLQHYASGKVSYDDISGKYYAKDPIKKVGGVCYYADSLGYSNDGGDGNRNTPIPGYSRIAPFDPSLSEGGVVQSEVEVTPVVGTPVFGAWTIEDWEYNKVAGTDIGKKIEHNCICDVDFYGYYNQSDVAIGIKHQGNSTMKQRKRNFRYTFYKNATYAKKQKIKFGEMLRLSGFNLKANAVDYTRVREMITYRIFVDVWNKRPITDRYAWDNPINGYYTGATGNIENFPIRLDVGGNFYGLYSFGLKKDEKNYMLDGEDESGFFIIGNDNVGDVWGRTLPYNVAEHYDDEMLDEMSQSTIDAMTNWTHFINNRLYNGSDGNLYNITQLTEVSGVMYVTDTLSEGQVVPDSVSAVLIPFDKENIPDRMDVLGFMDYFIGLQVFMLRDNGHNNLILYSGKEKKKVYPFFYDVDQSMRFTPENYTDDLYDGLLLTDPFLWDNIKDIYWDEIINRYDALRKSIINDQYITSVYNDVVGSIPDSDFSEESQKWGVNVNRYSFMPILELLKNRLQFLDEFYFNN